LASHSKTDELTQKILCLVDENNPQTVDEVLAFMQDKGRWSDKEIVATIMKLQAESKITLSNPSFPLPLNLASYVQSNQALWYWATIAVSILAMVFVLLISEDFYPLSYIRNVLGLIFVLWLPGYTFIKVLFPVNAPKTETSSNLSRVDRIALNITMSMALVALIGLVLNFSPWGINVITIVLSLLAFSLVFATVAVVREYSFIVKMRRQQMF
jgi:hypothetical protein